MPAGSTFRLGDVANVYSGSVGGAKIDKHASQVPLQKERRVLHPSFLQSPLLDVDRLPLRVDDSRAKLVLHEGNIVGRDLASDRRWTVLPAQYEGVQPGQGLLIIRVHQEIMPREYIAAYLSNSHVEDSMPLAGSVMLRLTRHAIADLIVPICAGDIQTIRQVSALLGTGAVEVGHIVTILERTQSEIFDIADSNEIRRRLEQAAGLSFLVAQSLRQQSEPHRSFQATYPYAIARAVRQLNHSSELPDRHEAALLCAESTILSIGIFSLAVAAWRSYKLDEIDAWLQALSRGGASLGHWVGIIRGVGNEARRTGESAGGLALATASGRRGTGLVADLEALVTYRNRVRHGSGPRTRAEIQRGLTSLEELVFSALESSTFLSRTRWIYINRIRWNARHDVYTMNCLSLMGDHPDFPPISIQTPQVYADEHLYLEISPSELVAIEPFCYLRDCSTCLAPELYYPDRVTSNSVILKSLDRGHELDDASIAYEITHYH